MTKTMRVLGLATALVTGVAGASFAAGGSLGSQNTTETQLNGNGQNQMLGRPANPGAAPTTGSTYGMSGGTTTGTYNGAVNSPTTPDASHSTTATSPSGGGAGGSSGGGAGGTGR
ncbi:MAG TPA: hypothetical protein VL614_02730 [Acetobacteraceae bacterium]|jgi:hypothetical protein|nr:hypothetical protein [Acetobacteraceae bacterium]